MKNKITKKIISSILFASLFSLVLFFPLSASAQVVSAPVLESLTAEQGIWTKIKSAWKDALGMAWKNALTIFLGKIAHDTAVWIASAGSGQEPLVFTEQPGEYLTNALDAAAGGAIEGFAKGTGFDVNAICRPPSDLLQLKIGLGLEAQYKAPPKPACTLSDALGNWEKLFADPNFDKFLNAYWDPGQNALSIAWVASDKIVEVKESAEKESWLNRIINPEYKPKTETVSGKVTTPSTDVKAQQQAAAQQAITPQTSYTGSAMADVGGIFMNTLIAKLMERIQKGLYDLSQGSELAELVSGETGVSTTSKAAAEAVYAEWQTPPLITGGTYSVVQDLVTCPATYAGTNNCVIGPIFQQAIEQNWTVQQFVDYLSSTGVTSFQFANDEITAGSDEGLTYRAILILKKYRIVPVGWQLAAELIRSGWEQEQTLQNLVDAYDQCTGDEYSPFCKLVDPTWVLKAPENYCNKEGYTEDYTYFTSNDTDANPNTQEKITLTRTQACVDDQSCLYEDDEGNCFAYGYCTEERRIYRFSGDSCNEQYATCQTFEDEEGNVVSYLKNTLNYGDCASGVGCQWYCQYPGDGTYACATQDTAYNTCDSGDSTYDMNEVCACTLEESCPVDAGSEATTNTVCTTTSGFTCTLADTCSSDDATYDSESDQCLCTTSESCNVDAGSTSCTTDSGGTCTLDDTCSSDSETYTYEETCTATETESGTGETCEISLGDYSCITGSGYTAYLGEPIAESDLGEDFSLNLDANAEECNEDDVGCHEFIRILSDTNLIFNNSFETFEGTADDTTADEFAYNDSGEGCASGSDCHGWQNNVSAYASSTNISNAYGSYAIVIPTDEDSSSSESLSYTLETGRSLANRTFVFQYYAQASIDDCSSTFEVNDYSETVTYSSDWDNISLADTSYTFPDDTDETAITVEIYNSPDCDIYIDVAGLWESDTAPEDYDDYGDNNLVYLNSERSECAAEEVGCELYTPAGGDEEDAIPGIITNPNEDACGEDDTYDEYENPTCSQCPAEMNGCDFYTIAATENTPPTERPAEEVSIIPSTGESCSAEAVGCEEYTNLDEVAAGGEGLEYYTYIRPCVTPEDTDIDTYYTWEGSDIAGYQLRAWTLKKSNIDDGPCTELDWESESATADCEDTGDEDCADDYGTDTDCREYYNAEGGRYYRRESETIWVSDDCHPLRNSLDNTVYYSIPEQSTTCSANENGCREYRGNDAGNAQEILNETFSDGSYGDWTASDGAVEVSSEALTTGDYSLILEDGLEIALYTSTTDEDTGGTTTSTDLEEGSSYLLTFWAKGDETLQATLDTEGFSERAELDSTNWKYYVLGPLLLDDLSETPVLRFSGATGYIDNIILTQSASQYLIKDTADTCDGYEGCTQYTDRADSTYYLKSFKNLCSTEAVGCEAIVDTRNSSSPFTQVWQDDNEYNTDDVTVPYDQIDFVVYDEDQECSESAKGCQAFGLPEINEQTGEVESYEEVYYLNNPDDYGTILCEDQHLSCKEYTSDYDGTVYFKDPGSKTCVWEDNGDGYKWYQSDSDELCTTQWSSDSYSSPAFPVCNENSENAGEPCNTDDDCETSSTASYPARCDSSAVWAGVCSEDQSGCTQYLDPLASNSTALNANPSFEDDVKDNAAGTYVDEGDGLPDEWDGGSKIDTVVPYDGLLSLGITDATVTSEDLIAVDPTKIYTLSGYFQVDDTTATVSLGLEYYDSNNNLISSQALAADGANFTSVATWHYFWGQVGQGSDIEFPESTSYVKIFITVSGTVYADLVEFKQQEEYFYKDYTVDGTSEFSAAGGTASCTTGQPNGLDCVAFRDTLESDISYSSRNNESYASCQITVNDDTCRQNADTADTNVILKVKPDRVCGEWLTCETSEITTDTQGNEQMSCLELGACNHLNQDGRCDSFVSSPSYGQLGTESDLTYVSTAGDTGDLDNLQNMSGYIKAGVTWPGLAVCSGGVKDGQYCEASGTDEDGDGEVQNCEDTGTCIAVTSGNTCGDDSGTKTGQSCSTNTNCIDQEGTCGDDYVCSNKINGVYRDCDDDSDCYIYGTCQGPRYQCVGGSKAGDDCTVYLGSGPSGSVETDSDPSLCEGDQAGICSDQFTIQGYYPFSWMSEVGSYDVTSASQDKDLIEVNDKTFENLYCFVDGEETDVPCVDNYDETDDNSDVANCLTTEVESHNEAIEQGASGTSWTEGSGEDHYYCPDEGTDPDWPFANWSGYNDGTIDVDQYDERFGSENRELESIDLNNVLSVSGGARYDLQSKVQQGSQYVLSFEGRYNGTISGDEGMSIAFEHSNGGRDYFAKGQGMADVVFVVDSTGSMSGVFDDIRGYVSSFASSLTSLGIDLRLALVDMDNNSESLALDLTDDVSAFQTAVDALSSEGAGTDIYTTLLNVASGSLEDGNQISYRGYATKVIILVTDVIPTSSLYYSSDDDTTQFETVYNTFSSGDTILYVINDGTTDIEETNYTALTEVTGGAYYTDLSNSDDWSTMLTNISDSIEGQIEEFVLSSDWQKYVLGPITVEGKEAASETTFLFFADATDFQIDNVSLLPAVEVNKDLDLISRSCRAYPESDSLQCDYTEASGMRFRGWKGYCLETDPQNDRKCILWWPVDVLEGEPDYRNKTKAGYADRAGAYYCLVAKGYADVAFFSGGTTGVQCNTTTADCFEGAFYEDDSNNIESSTIINAGWCEKIGEEESCNDYHDGNNIFGDNDGDGDADYLSTGDCNDCGIGPNCCNYDFDGDGIAEVETTLNCISDSECQGADSIDPASYTCREQQCSVSHTGCKDDNDCPNDVRIDYSGEDSIDLDSDEPYEVITRTFRGPQFNADDDYGEVARFAANDLETNIHRSEIEKIDLNIGGFGYGPSGGGREDCLWAPCDDDGDSNADDDPVDADLYESNGASRWITLSQYDRSATADDPTNGLPRYDNYMPTTYDGTYGVAWGPVEGDDDSANEEEDLIYLFTFCSDDTDTSVSDDNDAAAEIITGERDSNVTTFRDIIGEIKDIEDLAANHAMGLDTGSFTSSASMRRCNIREIKLDFRENGYLENIYVLNWYGIHGTADGDFVDPAYQWPMKLKYSLREPCAVIGQAVDWEGTNKAWSARTADDTYTLQDLNYILGSYAQPYGSIAPDEMDTEPTEWDAFDDEANEGLATAQGLQPPIVQPHATEGFTAGQPYACIGKCDAMVCSNDYSVDCSDDSSCDDDGYCLGGGASGFAGSGQGYGATNFSEQLKQAHDYALGYLKHLFANLPGTIYYFSPNSEGDIYQTNTTLKNDWDNTYETMDECSSERPSDWDTEYCGVRPTISDLAVDGQIYGTLEISSGEQVELTFTTEVDAEQLPLRQIYINWGDGNVTSEDWNAAPGEHSYRHYYTCTSASDDVKYYNGSGTQKNYYDDDSTECTALISVVITDNWDWCGGNVFLSGNDRRYNYNNDNVLTDCGVYYSLPVSIRVSQ